MSNWEVNGFVSAARQDELIRRGKMLFFLEERRTDTAHVCIDQHDGRLYVAVFMKAPYSDTRDFNAPRFVAVTYARLPELIQLAMRDARGRDAVNYSSMTLENWKNFINR